MFCFSTIPLSLTLIYLPLVSLFYFIFLLISLSSFVQHPLITILSVFNKCSANVQDGPRLENMVWRLWGRTMCCPECSFHSACSYPGVVASDESALSSDESAPPSSDEDHGDHTNDINSVHSSRSPTRSRTSPSLTGSNSSPRSKRPSHSSSAHHSAKQRTASTSSIARSESRSRSRRPSLLPHRSHSNTSIGKIMVDLLPDRLIVPNTTSTRNCPTSPIGSEQSMTTLAPSTDDIPAVVVMADGTRHGSNRSETGLAEQTVEGSLSGLGLSTQAPKVVIVNPTPHPTPPMTPHVQSPEHTTQDTSHRVFRDNLVVPSRGVPSAQGSSSSSSSSSTTTLAEASSTSPRTKPDNLPIGTNTIANILTSTGANGNGRPRSGVLDSAAAIAPNSSAVTSGNGSKFGTSHLPTEDQLTQNRHSHLKLKQSLPPSQMPVAPGSLHPQQCKFYFAHHAGSPDGDSVDSSGSSQGGSHSKSVAVGSGAAAVEPGTSVASGVSGISGTSAALSEVSGTTDISTEQSQQGLSQTNSRVKSDKSSPGGEMHIQTPSHAKSSRSSRGSTGSGSDILRMKTKARKGKDSRFARPLTRTQSTLRQTHQQQQQQNEELYVAPTQQQLAAQANRTGGKMVRVATAYQLSNATEKVTVNGAQRGVITEATAGPSNHPTAVTKSKSPRESAAAPKGGISPRGQQQLQQAPGQSQQQQQQQQGTTSKQTGNGAVASSSKARIDINDSDYDTEEDWEDESSMLSGDVTEDGDTKSSRSGRRSEEQTKAQAKAKQEVQRKSDALLKEATREAQRQSELFAKMDRKSYTNLARTQSGLLTSLLHPNPELFPQDHPYRLTRSTHDILALSAQRWPTACPTLPQVQGKSTVARPVAAAVTTEVSQSPSQSRSKLRLKGCPEADMEDSSGEEDAENAIQLPASIAEQRLAALQSKTTSRKAQQPPRPSGQPSHMQRQQQQLAQQQTQQAVPMQVALGYPYDLLPTPVPPSTPRTTRRNMLRKELPESLRRNLLWERQVSKQRPIGPVRKASSGNGTGEGDGEVSRNRPWTDEYHVAGW